MVKGGVNPSVIASLLGTSPHNDIYATMVALLFVGQYRRNCPMLAFVEQPRYYYTVTCQSWRLVDL